MTQVVTLHLLIDVLPSLDEGHGGEDGVVRRGFDETNESVCNVPSDREGSASAWKEDERER